MNASPIRVLFVSNDPSIFDTESPARARMRAYARELGTLHIVSKGKGPAVVHEDLGDGASLTLHAVSPYMLSGKKPFLFFELLRLSRKIIAKEKIEIVSAQDPFEYGWVAMKAVQGTTVKLHVQVHTDPFSLWFTRVKIIRASQVRMPLINKVRQQIADKVLPRADAIRCVSKRVQESLIKRYGDRIPHPSVIPIAVSANVPAAVPLPLTQNPFQFTLLVVGRLEPEKRVQDIILAVARIYNRYPAVGLVVIGEGSERAKLEKYTKQLGIQDRVRFLGHQDNAWGMMQSAQAYIQASGYEGYSRTLLEAALARVPIITTDVGIVGEVFRGYEEVLAAPPGDPTELSVRIIGFLEDNQARRQYAMNAEKAAREHLASVHTTPADIAQDIRNTLSTK